MDIKLYSKYVLPFVIVSSTGQHDEWLNDCRPVTVPKDSIRTRIVTFDTAEHFIIRIETLFVQKICFSVHKTE